MRAAWSSNAPSAESRGSTPSTSREPRARLHDVQLCGGLQRPLEVEGARAERVGQREENAMDFFGLLLLERDDVVVDFDGAERLEKQARAACRCAVHDPGNRAAMLRLDDQHVAAVAFGDDLILEVLRRLLAAQEDSSVPRSRVRCFRWRSRIELQLGTRVIGHSPDGSIFSRTGAVSRLNDATAPVIVLEQGKRSRGAADSRRAHPRPNPESLRAQAAAAVRAAALPPRARPAHWQVARRPERKERVETEIADGFARGRPATRDLPGSIARRQASQSLGAHRREGKALDGLDDAIEFECPQNARLHGLMVNPLFYRGSVGRIGISRNYWNGV